MFVWVYVCVQFVVVDDKDDDDRIASMTSFVFFKGRTVRPPH